MGSGRRWFLLLTLLLLGSGRAESAPQFVVRPGRGIGPITLGMKAGDLKRVFGAALSITTDQTVFTLPRQGVTAFTFKGRVVRIRTTNPNHRTESGFGPGDKDWVKARQALCNSGLSEASAVYQASGRFEIRCPLRGVIIEVSDGSIAGLSVILVQRLRSKART